jgi:hypothetical protein
MKLLFMLAAAILFLTSCGNNSSTAKTFCDTTCKSDSFNFKSADRFESSVSITVRDCSPDSVAWTHGGLLTRRQVPLTSLVNQDLRLHKDFIECVIKDTSFALLSFNDCLTGRGFMFKLPFSRANNITKYLGALNRFDPKFSIEKDLRAYTDRGSIFVFDVNSGKEAMMTFKEEYPIDFNKLHEVVDSINVIHSRIFVRLKKEGKNVDLEKSVSL